MPNRVARSSGFTLLEMMVVVAMIGILASTAIPVFRNYRLRSMRSEAYTNLAAIGRLQRSYFGEYGVYVDVLPQPGAGAGPLGPAKRNWTAAADAAFGAVGWQPRGALYFDYDTNAGNLAACGCNPGTCFTAAAYGDLDADGAVSVMVYAEPDANANSCPTSVLGFAPPIDPNTGAVIFSEVALVPLADDF